MATIGKRGEYPYIIVKDRNGRRKTISLGKVSDKRASAVLFHVNQLAEAVAFNEPPARATADWLREVGADLYAKLVAAGLATAREEQAVLELEAFIDGYIARRTDVKDRTRTNFKQAKAMLVAFFGRRRNVATINRAEAKDWHRGMMKNLATATVATHVKKARQFFADAVERKLIGENPFGVVKTGSQANEERQQFIPAADVLRVIDHCPDASWRVVFALARFGGLRTPSETRLLKWTDIDFDPVKGEVVITSPKTEGYKGRAKRTIPLFPELERWLLEARDVAEDGDPYVVGRLRSENLRTMAEKIIDRAGLTRWPRLFQNLRLSRQTELENVYPSHVVCRWMGNSAAVAKKHYLVTTEDHAAQARRFGAAPGAAPRHAMEAPVSHQNGENPRKSEGFAGNQYPQGESNEHAFSQGIEGVRGPALRRALRRLKSASLRIYATETSRLRRRVPSPVQKGVRA